MVIRAFSINFDPDFPAFVSAFSEIHSASHGGRRKLTGLRRRFSESFGLGIIKTILRLDKIYRVHHGKRRHQNQAVVRHRRVGLVIQSLTHS